MEKIHEMQSIPGQLLFAHNVTRNHPMLKGDIRKGSNPQGSLELDLPAPAQEWRGTNFLQESEEFMPDDSFKVSVDSIEEAGSTSFHGVSHPAEPIDTDLMRPVCVPIGQNNGDRKYLVRRLPVEGPSLEDLSIRVPNIKQSPSLLSPAGSLVEETNVFVAVSSPFRVCCPSQNIE